MFCFLLAFEFFDFFGFDTFGILVGNGPKGEILNQSQEPRILKLRAGYTASTVLFHTPVCLGWDKINQNSTLSNYQAKINGNKNFFAL